MRTTATAMIAVLLLAGCTGAPATQPPDPTPSATTSTTVATQPTPTPTCTALVTSLGFICLLGVVLAGASVMRRRPEHKHVWGPAHTSVSGWTTRRCLECGFIEMW